MVDDEWIGWMPFAYKVYKNVTSINTEKMALLRQQN